MALHPHEMDADSDQECLADWFVRRYCLPSTDAPAQDSSPGPKPSTELSAGQSATMHERWCETEDRLPRGPASLEPMQLSEQDAAIIVAAMRPDNESRDAWGIPTDCMYEVASFDVKPGSATVTYY